MPDTPKADEQQSQPTPQPIFQRHENFENWYANNIQYFPSEWDLKMVFGQLDWKDGNMLIEQHTAMAIAWTQVKLMIYFLTLQVGIYEMQYGKIKIPPSVRPPEPILPSGDLKDNPIANQVYEFIKQERERFNASLE